jgi:hypothetical protein
MQKFFLKEVGLIALELVQNKGQRQGFRLAATF